MKLAVISLIVAASAFWPATADATPTPPHWRVTIVNSSNDNGVITYFPPLVYDIY